MKLRIRGNSIRLRLLRGEVEQFRATGRVTETIQFGATPAAQLIYILQADSRAQQITTNFVDNQITVTVPEAAARNWAESEMITLTSEQPIENCKQKDTDKNGASEKVLKILIEKDFVCLDRKDEPDNADAFPRPTGKCE